MKMKYLLFTLLIAFGCHTFGQEIIIHFKGDNGKWGYMDVNENILVEAKYAAASKPFSSGMARIDLTHFINLKGERIYPKHRVIKAREYSDGLVAIETTKGWGFMDREGELIIPGVYKYVTDFDNGFAAVKNKEGYFIIDKEGNKQKIINNEKNKIAYVKRFSEGLAPIERGGHWGFVNEKGEIVIGTMFIGVGYFTGGLAWARAVNNKVGFIDKKGDWVIEPIFATASNFDPVSGLARIVGKDGKAYVDMKGEVKRFENSRECRRFYDGLTVETEGIGKSKFGFLNNKGEWAIPPTYWIDAKFIGGYAGMRQKGKWGVINKKGEWVIEPKYEYIRLNRNKSIVGMIINKRFEETKEP